MDLTSEPILLEFSVRPATGPDLPWISELQQKLYSVSDAVPLANLQEWFEANSSGFFIIQNHLQEPAGQITFLPLKPTCFDRYRLEGNQGLIETEIRGEDLYGVDKNEFISDLYLESLILPDENRPAAKQALMRAFPGIISKVRNSREAGNLFALAATIAGEKWLTKMGFLKISQAEARRDKHNLYRAALPDFLHRTAKFI